MKLNPEGSIAEQEVKREFVGEIGADIEGPERRQRHGSENDLQHPRQGERSQDFRRLAPLRVTGSIARSKQTVSHHQDGDERQKKDRVGRVPFAVLCRHRISGGLEH